MKWNVTAIGALIVFVVIVCAGLYLLRSKTPLSWEEMGALENTPVRRGEVRRFQKELKKVEGLDSAIPADFFKEHYKAFGPAVMLAALDEDQFCHAEAHGLGRVIYENTNDLARATAICGQKCSTGCIHGVLMGLFASSTKSRSGTEPQEHISVHDVTAELRAHIRTTCDTSAVVRYTGIGNCYHAVGHALMALADYDVSSGVGLCELFEEKGLGAVYYCATGAYMERAMAFGDEDIRLSRTYPCDESRYPAACFRYTLEKAFDLRNEYDEAAQLCLSLQGSYRRGCFHGLGFGAASSIYAGAGTVARVCDEGDAVDKRLCLEGVFGVVNVYDRPAASGVCASFIEEEQALCNAAAASENFGMGRDFELYTK